MQEISLSGANATAKVGEIGLGLMGMTFPNFAPREEPLEDEVAFNAMKTAIEAGATLWNAGVFYGFGPNGELINLELIARFFDKYPQLADKVFLAVKGGVNMKTHRPDGNPEFLRQDVDGILKALNGKKKLDLYEMARVDKNTPIEEVMGTLARFIKEGKFNHIGLSEVSASTIRRAAKVHPITTVEVEFSLWSIDILKNGVFEACQENNIVVAAYSPLGRGILSGKWEKPEDVPQSLKAQFPRYADENFEENKKFLDYVKAIAKKKNVSPAQIALKWILTQGKGKIIPIPGATRAERVTENCAAAEIELTKEELDEINDFVQTTEVKGGRYSDGASSLLEG